MKLLAIAAIDGYQRFISPYKGFGCAHRVQTGRASCSQFAKRAIARLGMVTGLLLTMRRFEACAESARILSSTQAQPAATPPEAPTEACPVWSRWGAKKLSVCCACCAYWPS
ncbi:MULTISPECIES: membrane protein insertion efficiency factor YidD [unclassified Variovorax]|uniref:membrane protein insertion efficiency factor YidD n=1 Tax=uncultured Variovorax sp. TaxID=114708 RepID=UPI000F7E4FBD|nr:membrane protein insertion efficiency factor YidD [Variovorax sp. 553]RSZ48251.1 membrane protein insertion efficiency factor YidD [Variovorax sp. 679]